MRLWSRSGHDWSAAFAAIVLAMEQLPVENVIIDGEAVCLLEDGRPDFHALRSRQACRGRDRSEVRSSWHPPG